MKLLAVLALVVLAHAKPAPKDSTKPKPKPKDSRLVEQEQSQVLKADEETALCSTSKDCDRDQYCDTLYGTCVDDIFACYDSDECRGRQICDMRTYSCVDPTPSPTRVGCCAGDSKQSTEKCNSFNNDPDRCEDRDSCEWRDGEYADCDFESTTTTVEPGCCYGESVKDNDRCGGLIGRQMCERSGNCEFREGEDADCSYVPTTTTEQPGCCKGLTFNQNDMCNEKDYDSCERSAMCEFIEGEDADCTMTTTSTTTPAPGCCRGDSYKANEKCSVPTDQDMCESKGCEWLETDDPDDCVITSTTSTTTTIAPGCCYGDSYQANTKCGKAVNQDQCEARECNWMVTDDPSDCEITTTSTITTTPEPGCCAGDSKSQNDRCNEKDTQDMCERSSSCHWRAGEDADCTIPPTTTITPGCCFMNPDTAYNAKWQDVCIGYYTERECLMLTNGDGEARCRWEDLGEGYDCSLLWPTTTTTTEEPGCCKGSSYKNQDKCLGFDNRDDCERRGCEFVSGGEPEDCVITTTSTTTSSPTTTEEGCCKADSMKRQDMCDLKDTKKKCDRSSSCHWLSGPDETCEWEATTTVTPGCCYINPEIAYSRKFHGACIGFYTERECITMVNDDGEFACAWEDLVDGYDCSQLWPTTTTTTEEPGCCYGDSYKANSKCLASTDQDRCESRGCNWMVTEDPDDCLMTTTSSPTTTSTTEEPGCCKGDSYKSQDKCLGFDNRDDCERRGCEFVSGGEPEDCLITTSTTTAEPGCCYGATPSTNDMCAERETRDDCERSTKCEFRSGEDADCTLPATTPSPTDAPGCCYGDSYKANDKCSKAVEQEKCEFQGCNWLKTDDPEDCVFTTTSSPTTTEEPGCCKGDSVKSNDKCNDKETRDKCDRSSSCHWISGGVLEEGDCDFGTTEPPEDPGCCYGNPDAAYSSKWMEVCTEYYTERECLMLENDDGEPRCKWESKSENYDCSMLWPTTTSSPTTTTPAPGCCRGESYKANDMCAVPADEEQCLGRGCEWVVTDDPSECVITTTETPTTTMEPGCCYGEGPIKNEMCGQKIGRELCERAGDCEFRPGDDANCVWTTTTSEATTTESTETPTTESPTLVTDPTTTSEDDPDECGCCVIRGGDVSSRWLEECGELLSKSDCNMPLDVDHNHRCMWIETEPGFDKSECDTFWPTTTSTPWLTEKAAEVVQQIPKPKPKAKAKDAHLEQEMAVGGESVVSQVTATTVSLSSVLLCGAVALVMYVMYSWWAQNMDKGAEGRETRQSRVYYNSI